MNDYSIHLYDILVSTGWIILASIIAFVHFSRHETTKGYQYFRNYIIWKIFIAISFAVIYTTIYGGDTTAYFEGALTLKKLALQNPTDYFKELFNPPNIHTLPSYFNLNNVGAPPMWIYKESNSWFVSKLASIILFVSFDSYLCTNLIFTFISTAISWRFFRFLVHHTNISQRYLAIAILFIPTVNFWCSGLMKDTIVFISLITILQSLFTIIFTKKIKWKTIITLMLGSVLLLSTRSFVLMTVTVVFEN